MHTYTQVSVSILTEIDLYKGTSACICISKFLYIPVYICKIDLKRFMFIKTDSRERHKCRLDMCKDTLRRNTLKNIKKGSKCHLKIGQKQGQKT